MTSTQATPRAHLRRTGDRGFVLRVVVIAVVCVALIVGLTALMRGPNFVHRLTVDNPTALPLEVSVAGPGSNGRLNIGSVGPRSRTAFEDVVDMGDDWEIRVVANGGAVATTTVTRAELVGDDWTFTIPATVRSELTRGGAIPGLGD
jgi:hypothetical protein